MSMLVCKLFKIAKIDGQFDKEHKKLLRSRAVITQGYYDQINSNWETAGKLYVIDKKATSEYEEDAGKQLQARRKKDEVRKMTNNKLVDAIESISAESAIVIEKDNEPSLTEKASNVARNIIEKVTQSNNEKD